MRPKVSVILPTFNRGSMIANAILSIQNQTEENWELIIVDDGSEDHTSFIVRQFEDERIRYFHCNHQGLVAAQNYGIAQAKAEIITLQGSDDLSMPDRLEKSLKEMNEYDVLYHGLYLNSWNKVYGAIDRKYVPADKLDKQRLIKEQYIPGVPFFKKSLWEKKPFRMETQFAYDWMMYLDWAFSGATFKNLDLGLYEYVRTEDSASVMFERTGQRQESMEKIKQIMKDEYAAH